MKKTAITFFIISMLVLSILLVGCSGSSDSKSSEITGKATATVSSPDDPQIDQSYDIKRSDAPTRTTTPTSEPKTTTTKTATTTTKTTTTKPQTISDEDHAIATAKAFVKNLDGYKSYNGKNIKLYGDVVGSGCAGCWIVEFTFERERPYYPDKTEFIKVQVKMKDWKVQSYTFG